MVFSSLTFLFVYLLVVFGIYKITPLKYRNLWLFLTSLFFYGWGEHFMKERISARRIFIAAQKV